MTDRVGRLCVVATPIGNLEDITLRALRVLRTCDLVLAEDTRRTRALLSAHGIERPVERLDDHVVHEKLAAVLDRLRDGQTLALVSDAGMPLVSDPGAPLVRAAVEEGIAVDVVPGPSAALHALVVSTFGGEGFRFVGFLPRDGVARRAAITAMASDPLPTVFFESPERIARTLDDLVAVCGPTRAVSVSRELTKMYEETLRGALDAVRASVGEGLRGEVTAVLSGAPAQVDLDPAAALDAALDAALAAGMRPSDAAREVARAMGLKRADVYARVMQRAR